MQHCFNWSRGLVGLVLVWSIPGSVVVARAATPAVDIATLVERLRTHAQAAESCICQATYQAESKTRIYNADGKLEKTIRSVREVTFRPPDDTRSRYLSMWINDRALSEQEMRAEVAKMKEQGGRSPFAFEEMDNYHFALAGETEYAGWPVWIVDYEPKTPGEGLAVGRAYIVKDSYNVAYLSFKPSKTSSVVQSLQAEVHHRPVGQFWLASSFTMDLHIKVTFLITLADQRIHIDETYSHHQMKLEPAKEQPPAAEGKPVEPARAGGGV